MCCTRPSRRAVVGEPHAAVRVEHDVVRADERVAVALGVEHLHVAGREVDALDAAAASSAAGSSVSGIVMPMISWKSQPPLLHTYTAPSGPIASAVRAAAGLGDRLLAAVGMHPVMRPPQQLDDEHRAVGHRDRSLGELAGRR